MEWSVIFQLIDPRLFMVVLCLLGNRICAEANAQGSELEHCIFGYGRIDSVHNRLDRLERGKYHSRHTRRGVCGIRPSGR